MAITAVGGIIRLAGKKSTADAVIVIMPRGYKNNHTKTRT